MSNLLSDIAIPQTSLGNPGKYRYDPEKIVEKIPITHIAGREMFLCCCEIKTEPINVPSVINTYYFVLDSEGNSLARLRVCNNGYRNELEIEYSVRSEYQGCGVGTVALSAVVDDIFSNKRFDNLPFKRMQGEQESLTNIERVFLSINSDNVASQRVAEKNCFKQTDDTTFVLTRDDYLSGRKSG